MKRTLLVALLLVAVLVVAFGSAPPAAKAWGPCDGQYGGYAGCNYYNSCYGCGYSYYYPMYSYYGYGYNRVCRYGYYGQLYCTYVRVPPYPVSGYYPNYGGYAYYGGYGW